MPIPLVTEPQKAGDLNNQFNLLIQQINVQDALIQALIAASTYPNKLDGVGAPDANDDSADTNGNGAFEVGSFWLDTDSSPHEAYRCMDATPTAAIWLNTTLELGDLGSMAVQAANAVAITGGTITGVTNMVLDNAVNAFTKQQNFAEAALVDGANIAWDLDDAQAATVTLAGNRTLDNPTNMVAGGTYVLRVVQDGTGTRTLAYDTAYKFPGGVVPVLTPGVGGAVDYLTFVSDGTNMFGVFQGNFS